ncbi:MAG: hypothetical protein HRT88_21330 [Lentisphaeraceae bacterium]|nr:hypothetical protein [Lentisphaeraceae bacterium]
MGAEFRHYISKVSQEELGKDHCEYQSRECDFNGNDTYAGHIGIMPSGIDYAKAKPFKSSQQAIDYLEENHCKWDCAMAAPFIGETLDYGKQSKAVLKRQQKLEVELLDLKAKILQCMRSTKSKTIGCKSCGSSVARHYLNDAHCPVCSKRDSFYSATQAAAIKSKTKQLTELKKKPLHKVKAPGICHVVGGWCAS